MHWLIIFVAVWCIASLIFQMSSDDELREPWTTFLLAGIVGAVVTLAANLVYHTIMAFWLYLA